jgi:hypothetical protein
MTTKDSVELDDKERRLLFDWYNHITTSGLIIIGGIIGFLPKTSLPVYAVVALGLVISGSAIALGGSARLRPNIKSPRFWKLGVYFEQYAHVFVGAGAGVFIGGFAENLI